MDGFLCVGGRSADECVDVVECVEEEVRLDLVFEK